MAADQIIHPFVNKIAGQYYRKEENRLEHRNCEVYQDVVLYDEKKKESICNADLDEWLDISTGWLDFEDTDPYFRIFLQKAFIEAHAITPSEDEIEGWVDGLLLLLKYIDDYGPFKDADKDYQQQKQQGKSSEQYRKFWLNQKPQGGTFTGKNDKYMDYYNQAVELALIYVKTAFMIFDINIDDFSDEHRINFLKIVKNADLTNPLDRNILDEVKNQFNNWIP
jgi:hypothetical protein